MSSNPRIMRKVRKEFDYLSYVEENFSVKHSPNGELRVCCPNCVDSKYKLYVNDEKKYFNCFKCNFNSGNYDVFDFVSVTEGLSRGQSILRLCREHTEVAKTWQELIDDAKSFVVEDDDPSVSYLPKPIDSMPRGSEPLTKREAHNSVYWDYLLDRGFTEGEILATKAHCVPSSSVFVFDDNKKMRGNIGKRILFPVYGGGNQLVAWLGRSIDGTTPKYFNAPDSDMSQTFWPFVPSPTSQAVLVEGLIDSLAVRRIGLSAYATFGKKVSYGQIAQLKKWAIKEVVLFWDKKDAKKEMLKAIGTLQMHFDVVKVPDFSMWPDDKDSGDTLKWEGGSSLLKDMLTNHLVDVNSIEFSVWKAG